MKKLLVFAAMGEVLTGLLLLVYPQIVVLLLFGARIADAGVVMSRIAGIALIALGLACLPSGDPASRATRAFQAMLSYSLLAALYLLYLGLEGAWVGSLLWSAVIAHLALTVLLVLAWFQSRD